MKAKIFLCLCLLLLFTASASAWYHAYWSDASEDHQWNDIQNWDQFEIPRLDPGNGTGIGAAINYQVAPKTGAVINGGQAYAEWVGIGYDQIGFEPNGSPRYGQLTVTDGNLTITDWLGLGDGAGTYGQIIQTGGRIKLNTQYGAAVGNNGTGQLIMQDTDGNSVPYFDCNSAFFRVGNNPGSSGEILLYDGTLHANTFSIISGLGTMDVERGQLIVSGNITTALQTNIDRGELTAYDSIGTFNLSYDSDSNTTHLTANVPATTLIARKPSPRNDITGTQWVLVTGGPVVTLSWSPGDGAVSHNVYSGTDFNDVNNASNPNSYPGYGNTTATTFDVPVTISKTYYWRIDEVNSAGTVSKGHVWQFTTRNYVQIEDFSSYSDSCDLNLSWNASSGAVLTLDTSSNKYMHYAFDTNDSNATLTFGAPQNWSGDLKALHLDVYGSVGNPGTKHMKISIKDANGHVSPTLTYTGDINVTALQGWDMPIASFNNGTIDLTRIKKLIISFTGVGSGSVGFDNINLYPPRCMPEFIPFDLTGDCAVNFDDLVVMVSDWLKTDSLITAVTPKTDPNYFIAWYQMEDAPGSTAVDSSGNGHNAPLTGANWTTGHTGGGLLFNRASLYDQQYATCGTFDPTSLGEPNKMSITFWIYWQGRQFMGGPGGDWQTFIAKRKYYTYDATNWVWWIATNPASTTLLVESYGNTGHSLPIFPANQWVHVAVTLDQNAGGSLKVYYNGLLQAEFPGWHTGIGTDPTTPVLLGACQPWDTPYCVMDDVRFYGYVLSQAEIVSTMGQSSLYLPLVSKANISDDEAPGSKVVNFKDFALMAEHWFQSNILWP